LSQDLEEKYLNYKMVTSIFDFQTVVNQPNFMVKNYKDSYYLGEILPERNVREGMGVCVYGNTRLFEGFWKNDKREGRGFERFSNGN